MSRNSLNSAHLEADVELGCITVAILGQRWDQLFSAAAKDEIHIIGGAAPSFAVVRDLRVDFIGDRFIEVKLRSELLSAPGGRTGAYFKVNVNSTARVPA